MERWTWQTRVRISEVGPDQIARPRHVLNWMQEAAGTASEAVGYSRARFRQMGAAWFIREVVLRFRAPIGFGDEVRVETWVYDLRRFRTEREYRVWVGDRVVAEAAVEWLFLELTEDGRPRPRRPTDEMQLAFPRIPERVLVPQEVLPAPAPGEAWVVCDGPQSERRVWPSDLDENRHANHAAVAGWFDDHLRAEFGVDADVRALRVRYEKDVQAGDALSVRLEREGDLVRLELLDRSTRVAWAAARLGPEEGG